jgi:hypothetical protein
METGEAKFRIKNGKKGPKEKKIYKMMAKARLATETENFFLHPWNLNENVWCWWSANGAFVTRMSCFQSFGGVKSRKNLKIA